MAASTAPVARKTAKAPPMIKAKKMMSCASLKPLGMAVRLARGDNAGASGVNWKLREPTGVVRRLSPPARTPGGKQVGEDLGQDHHPEEENQCVGNGAFRQVAFDVLVAELLRWRSLPVP